MLVRVQWKLVVGGAVTQAVEAIGVVVDLATGGAGAFHDFDQ